jgi:hypothetical protein
LNLIFLYGTLPPLWFSHRSIFILFKLHSENESLLRYTLRKLSQFAFFFLAKWLNSKQIFANRINIVTFLLWFIFSNDFCEFHLHISQKLEKEWFLKIYEHITQHISSKCIYYSFKIQHINNVLLKWNSTSAEGIHTWLMKAKFFLSFFSSVNIAYSAKYDIGTHNTQT